MNKKAINNQIFVYIFAILVIGLILIFGIRTIGQVKIKGDQAEVVKFFNDVDAIVERVYDYDVGSSVTLDKIRVPGVVKRVCFEDHDSYVNVYVETIPGVDIDPNDKGIDNVNVDKLRILTNGGLICKDKIGGKIEITLEKKYGTKTYVEAT